MKTNEGRQVLNDINNKLKLAGYTPDTKYDYMNENIVGSSIVNEPNGLFEFYVYQYKDNTNIPLLSLVDSDIFVEIMRNDQTICVWNNAYNKLMWEFIDRFIKQMGE